MEHPIYDIKKVVELAKEAGINLRKMFMNETKFNSMLELEKCKNKRAFYRKYKKVTGENCPVRIIIVESE